MNKEKFLKELEKKLSILTEEERKDTINEYRDIIEEKVKHGKTEEEAVKEFGSIDELSKEILSAYKINPDYNEKSFTDSAEDLIKKGAKKISEVTDEVVESVKKSDFKMSSETVIEMALKFILLLVFLAILRIPFHIMSGIGSEIFDFGFLPFSKAPIYIWKFFLVVVYIVICVVLIVKLFENYFKKEEIKATEKKETKKEEVKKETKTTKKQTTKSESKKEPVKEVREKKSNDVVETLVLLLVRLFVVFVFIIPLIAIVTAIVFVLIALLYLLLKGVGVYGFIILTIGGLIFALSLLSTIFRGFMTKKKVTIVPYIVAIVFMIVGGIMSVEYVTSFSYKDELPKNKYKLETKVFKEKIDKKTRVIESDRGELSIDNKLEDNEIKIVVEYYPKFVEIEKETEKNEEEDIIKILSNDKQDYSFDFFTKDIIKDLKNKRFYNYNYIDETFVKVYVNEDTRDLVELD